MEQNANMGAHMATHISGRATVAVDAYVFRRAYIKLQMYRYYSKSVSYIHLTLPTKRIVLITRVAASVEYNIDSVTWTVVLNA